MYQYSIDIMTIEASAGYIVARRKYKYSNGYSIIIPAMKILLCIVINDNVYVSASNRINVWHLSVDLMCGNQYVWRS